MTDVRYSNDSDSRWVAMVAAGQVLVVARTAGAQRLADLWASLHDAAGTSAVLDALTRGGISSTPPFALIGLPPSFDTPPTTIGVTVRGAIQVAVSTAAGSKIISASAVSTWVDQSVADVVSITVGEDLATAGAESAAADFVLVEGSAPMSFLRIGQSVAVPVPPPGSPPRPVSAPPAPVVPAAVPVEVPIAAPPPPAPVTPAPAPVAETAADPGVTITGVTITEAPPRRSDPDDNDGKGASGYDFLFGETVVRTVEDAAVREGESSESAGDHDGRTAVGLSAAERKAARAARRGTAPAVDPSAPQFLLVFSTGLSEPLEGSLIVGRAPSASKVSVNSVPRLITIEGPDQDISRNHVEISLEGGTVMVTDLHSRNGTIVTLPGRAPQQLRGGAPTAVIAGAVIDLGSEITITVQER